MLSFEVIEFELSNIVKTVENNILNWSKGNLENREAGKRDRAREESQEELKNCPELKKTK
ncbi:hypothetical protein cpbgf_7001365 [Cryptosporidium parvum]|uniref:Uncharacterized protein n=1 Tax=Cryptosporidium parvum TaxID=5807 RepID=A0A7S7RF34_CRYPV|nr:hypothetical protein CPATCC_0007100 [Cryptosporidium parvum]WRK33302.1 hypothetical protein cpbgf_7001365 [Cryptosporidium parvum]|eukprot:QOY40449.1 hypothetical protein CPATCC_003298 [Cryptosporidium parvum]